MSMYMCEHVCVPLWKLMYVFERTPGRKIVTFRNIKTAISPQPLNEIYGTKTKLYLEASFLLCVVKKV